MQKYVFFNYHHIIKMAQKKADGLLATDPSHSFFGNTETNTILVYGLGYIVYGLWVWG
jgi:hypothetical protein